MTHASNEGAFSESTAREGAAAQTPDEVLGELAPLPRSVDAQGLQAERPEWGRLITLPVYMVAMVAGGVVVAWMGSVAIGVIIALLGVVPAVGVFLFASARFPKIVGPRQKRPEEPELGGVLGADEAILGEWAPTLIRDEVSVLEANRAKEAAATEAWLAGAPAFERVETTSADGTALVGHACACAPDSKRWVVLAHGYAGSWRDGFMHARRYAEQGYNLLLVDMRAHGESAGAWVGLGWLDREDLVAWATWLVGREGADVRVVFHGMGMGAAAALMASAEEGLPSQVRAVVADSAYADVWNVGVRLLTPGDGKSSPHPMIDIMRLALRLRAGGYDVALAKPEDAVSHAKVPVFLVQGDQDTLVPPYMATRLKEACGGAAAGDDHVLSMVEGAGHGEAALADPVGYYWRLFTFLGRYL